LPNRNSRRLGLIPDAFYLGFISLSIQVIYARLAVGFAGGNEVYLSIYFFFWLMFTGIGALVIKKLNPAKLFIAFGISSVLMAIAFFSVSKLAGIFAGQIIPPGLFLATIAVILLPVCLLNGGLFSLIAASFMGKYRSGMTYWGEALGALAGGIVTTIYYSAGGRDYSLLFFIGCICFIPLIKNNYFKKIVIIFCGIIIALSGVGDLWENLLLKIRYHPLAFQNSVCGRLIRYDSVRTGEITTLYSGGLKLADFPDEIAGQEIFYWPYLVKPDMSSAAFIGAQLNMVDRLIPESIDRLYIYPEKKWRKLINKDFVPSEEICRAIDPLAYLKRREKKFDAIIVNLGYLLSLSHRRYETGKFFNLCKSNISEGGILSVSVPAYDGIWRDDLKQRLNEIYKNLKKYFNTVSVIPGSRLTYVCGDSLKAEISPEVLVNRCYELNIDSPYFNPALITSRLNSFKLDQVEKQLSAQEKDTGELAIGHGLSYYFSMFDFSRNFKKIVNYRSIGILVLIVLGIVLTLGRFNGGNFLPLINVLYFGAFSFIIELMVLYYFQLSGGYLYMALGIIVGLFMAGMAGGAFWETYNYNRKPYLPKNISKGSLLAIILFGILTSLLLLGHDKQWILLIVVVLAGFAGGLGFAANAKLYDRNPGLPYGVDLGGAMIGTAVGLGILYSTMHINEMISIFGIIGIILFATNFKQLSKT